MNNNTVDNFPALPTEILDFIVEELPYADQSRFVGASKRFKDIVDNSPRRIVEFYIAAYIEAGRAGNHFPFAPEIRKDILVKNLSSLLPEHQGHVFDAFFAQIPQIVDDRRRADDINRLGTAFAEL